MLFKSVVRIAVLTGMGCIVLMALSIAIAGCGKSSEEREMPVRVVHDDAQRTQTPGMLGAGMPAAVTQPEEVVAAPEPQREVTYEEAEAAYLERRYNDAMELFIRYTQCNERNPWGYYMLGLSAGKTGDTETAQAAFEQALGLDPGHVKSWLNLGRVLLDAGRADEALVKIDEALAVDPDSNDGFRLQGRAFHQLGKSEEAIAAYRRAIQIDGEDAWSMNNLALILIEREDFDAALPPLALAVEIRNDVALFHNNLGMALERTGHMRAAEDAYRMANVIDSFYEHAAMNLARVETVREDPATRPVDLAAVALEFKEEIATWKATLAVSGSEAAIQPEAEMLVTGAADSTGGDHTP